MAPAIIFFWWQGFWWFSGDHGIMGFSEVFLTAAGYMEAIEEGSPGSPLDDGMMGQSTNVYHIPWQFWLVMGKKAYESIWKQWKIKEDQGSTNAPATKGGPHGFFQAKPAMAIMAIIATGQTGQVRFLRYDLSGGSLRGQVCQVWQIFKRPMPSSLHSSWRPSCGSRGCSQTFATLQKRSLVPALRISRISRITKIGVDEILRYFCDMIPIRVEFRR